MIVPSPSAPLIDIRYKAIKNVTPTNLLALRASLYL